MEVDDREDNLDQLHSYEVQNPFGMSTRFKKRTLATIQLVQPRAPNERVVVNVRQTDRRNDPEELVTLAAQLSTARELVKGRACERLRTIAEQMEQLHLAARKVLEEATRDEDLHSIPCNMQKHAGRVYHLYRRTDGYRYFSMLSPEDWQKMEKQEEFIGSYRLEYDRSWTLLEEVEERDRKFAQFESILKTGSSALGWKS